MTDEDQEASSVKDSLHPVLPALTREESLERSETFPGRGAPRRQPKGNRDLS